LQGGLRVGSETSVESKETGVGGLQAGSMAEGRTRRERELYSINKEKLKTGE